MNIERIELEGTEYPIAFTTAALAEFEKAAGVSTVDFLAQLDAGMVSFTHLCALVASGLNAGARKAKTGTKFTAEEAGDMVAIYDVPRIMPILKKYLSISQAAADTDAEEQKNALGAPAQMPEA